MIKSIVSGIAVIITFIAFYPYLKAILANKIKPHFFSWIIWGVTTFVAFLGQVSGNGGVGTISMGLSSIITFYIAYLTFRRRGDLSVRALDWVYLILAAFSIPVWMITNDPLWAVVIMTGIDLLGFGPTFRNAYENPSNEDPVFYLIFTFRNLLAIYALETYSVTTILFPAAISVAGVFVAVIVWVRKKKLLL
ncbi:MAG: hypothetical protein ACFHWX_14160 [Bacteroidota bacterium]